MIENAGVYPGGPKATGQGLVLTGLSTPNQMKKAVEKGVVAKFQLWDPADMGLIASYLAGEIPLLLQTSSNLVQWGTLPFPPSVGGVTMPRRHARVVAGCNSLPYDLAVEIEGMFEIA
mgnify:CR=1 FL=1